jgi:hypothetical protein
VPTAENFLSNLPDDKETLKAMLRSFRQERERQEKRAEEQRRRADELYLETLRLKVELERYKKATYGPSFCAILRPESVLDRTFPITRLSGTRGNCETHELRLQMGFV